MKGYARAVMNFFNNIVVLQIISNKITIVTAVFLKKLRRANTPFIGSLYSFIIVFCTKTIYLTFNNTYFYWTILCYKCENKLVLLNFI